MSYNSWQKNIFVNWTAPHPQWLVEVGENEVSIQVLIFCSIHRKNNFEGNGPPPLLQWMGWQTLFLSVVLDISFQFLAKHFGGKLIPTSCADVDISLNSYWKKNFLWKDPLTPHLHTSMRSLGLAKITFQCTTGYFIQFLARKKNCKLSPTHWGEGLAKMTFLCISGHFM